MMGWRRIYILKHFKRVYISIYYNLKFSSSTTQQKTKNGGHTFSLAAGELDSSANESGNISLKDFSGKYIHMLHK